MLRLPFSAADLANTRFAPGPAPLIELSSAVAMLQRRDPLFAPWRRAARRRLPSAAGPLFELVAPTAQAPLFVDPVLYDADAALEAVRATPQAFVRDELRRTYHDEPAVGSWLRSLDDGRSEAREQLAAAVATGHAALVGEHWSRICACYRVEVDLRARQWARTGLGAALTAIHPGTTWDGEALTIPIESRLRIDFGGRGAIMQPSVLWRGRPMFTRDPDGTIVIVYAAATPLPLSAAPAETGEAGTLAALLGANRAAVLASTAAPRTTTELARAADISLAAASQHATVLRNAGLITTARGGRHVTHSLTTLGQTLLEAG